MKDHGCPLVANMDDPTTAAKLPVLQNTYRDLITFIFRVKQWESEGLLLVGYTHFTNTIMCMSLGFLFVYLTHKYSTADEIKFVNLETVCNVHFTYIYNTKSTNAHYTRI